MATNFPTSLDTNSTLPAESASTPLSINHVTAHQNIQDAIEAVEAKVGANSSAVTTSHDYKLNQVTGTERAMSTGSVAQSASNKTFTTTTVNGVTLSTSAGASNFLTGAGTYVSIPVSDASTSAKGVVEIATTAEINAGTATGSTGAPIAITPDQLAASAPTFSAVNLTNIPDNSGYAVGTMTQDVAYAMQIPIIATSSSAITNWTLVTTTVSNINLLSVRLGSSASSSFATSTLLPSSTNATNYTVSENKQIRLKWRVKFPDTLDIKSFGFCISPTTIFTSQTDVTNGSIRFVLNGAVMYAHNSNGTTATTTNVSGSLNFTNWNTFEIIFTPGTSAVFYINGSVVATHTTNLPTTGILLLAVGANLNGRQVDVMNPVISLER